MLAKQENINKTAQESEEGFNKPEYSAASFDAGQSEDINQIDANGYNALQYAALLGEIQAAKLLLEMKADINFQSQIQPSPLLLAIEQDQGDVVRLLLENKAKVDCLDKYNQPVLISAVTHGSYNAVKALLDDNFDVDITDQHGLSSLKLAIIAYVKCLDMNPKKTITFENIIKLLLSKHASISKQSNDGISVMSLAIDLKTCKILELILESDPNINLNFNSRKFSSPLHEAVMVDKEEMCRILLKNKTIKVDRLDNIGLPPIYYALHTKNHKIIKLLLEAGANVHLKCNQLTIAAHIRRLGDAKMIKILDQWISHHRFFDAKESRYEYFSGSSQCNLM